MAASNETGLVVPIQGSHITDALHIARVDQEGFWQSEMNWLEANNPQLWLQTTQLFVKVIGTEGPTNAEASRGGRLLGHYAVRLCAMEQNMDYRHAASHYQRNRQQARFQINTPGRQPTADWNTEATLSRIFDDEGLVTALMDIQSELSCHAAAVAIAFFCLPELPKQL